MKKFIPQSPDPFLKKPEDMTLAKFGHLNELVKNITNIEETIAIPTVIPSGIFGISNAAGVYTYYNQFNDAVAACPVGGTIEQFADYINTYDDLNGSYQTIDKSLNFNMNGHSFRNSIAGSYPLTVNTAATDIVNISNGHIDSLAAYTNGSSFFVGGIINLESVTVQSNIEGQYALDCSSAVVKGGVVVNTSSTGHGVNSGVLINVVAYVAGSGDAMTPSDARNCNAFSASGTAIQLKSTFAENCTGISNTGIGVYVKDYGRALNCVGRTNTTGVGFKINAGGNAVGCTGFSGSGIGMEIEVGFNIFGALQNLSGFGVGTGVGMNINVVAGTDNIRLQKLNAHSVGGIGMTITKSTAGNILLSEVNVHTQYNNAAGHGISVALSGGATCTLAQGVVTTTHASANCLYAAAATNLKYGQLMFGGATTPVNANITQTLVNIADAQGNLVI
jgi:hypothetical protein